MTRSEEQMLSELDAAISAVASADDAYWAAVAVQGVANSLMTEMGLAYRLYLM